MRAPSTNITDTDNIPPPPPFSGLNMASLQITYGEHLPRWQCNNAIYHVSFRLADSVPKSVREQWLIQREIYSAHLKQSNADQILSFDDQIRIKKVFTQRIEQYLDAGHGSCYLNNPEVAQIMIDALWHFNGLRYHLHAWCVMPNHVHIIVEPISGYDLLGIIHSWKSSTARKMNKFLNRTGDFWMTDAYNRIIRSGKEYEYQINYTWNNPDKAGLKDWKWRWKVQDEASSI